MRARPAITPDDRPAGLGRRFVAVLVDQTVVLLLGGGVVVAAVVQAAVRAQRDDVAAATTPAVPGTLVVAGAALALAVTLVQWLVHGRHGWTVGRRLLGVRTVDVHSRLPVGPGRVLLRGLVVTAGVLVLGVGQYAVLLSPLLDRTGRRRGWHDRAVDAEVLLVGRGAASVPARSSRPVAGAGRPARDDGAPVPAPPAWPSPASVPGSTGTPSPVLQGVPRGPSVPRGRSVPTPVGGLVLAPVHPQRSAPDLDTRAIAVVRPEPTLAFGLAPELETTRPAPPRADVVPEQRTPTTTGLRVALDDGRVLTVERLALVGRNPTAGPELQVVRVVDPARSVSKTHLQLAVDPSGGAWVVDRGSTNGTLVTLPDGGQVVCLVDHPVRLREGAVVVFGDRSLRVVSVPPRAGGADSR